MTGVFLDGVRGFHKTWFRVDCFTVGGSITFVCTGSAIDPVVLSAQGLSDGGFDTFAKAAEAIMGDGPIKALANARENPI